MANDVPTPEQKEEMVQEAAKTQLFSLTPDELKVDLKPVDNVNVEILVSKAYGNAEQVSAKVTVPLQNAQAAVLAVAQRIFGPRAYSYAAETVDVQLEADRMTREMERRNKIDSDELERQRRGKK